MKRNLNLLLSAGVVSVTILGAASAFAGTDAAEIALFQKSEHSIAPAIKTAEKATGGKAMGAEFGEKNGAGLWTIKTVAGNKTTEVKIDSTTGQVVATKEKSDVVDNEQPVTPEMLAMPLADLVSKAEASGEGKVISIDYEHEKAQSGGIEVEIVKTDGSLHDFIMNPADGKLTPTSGQNDHDESNDDDN